MGKWVELQLSPQAENFVGNGAGDGLAESWKFRP